MNSKNNKRSLLGKLYLKLSLCFTYASKSLNAEQCLRAVYARPEICILATRCFFSKHQGKFKIKVCSVNVRLQYTF